MSDTKIKLCGMMDISDIEMANELQPDYIGFIFWEKSFRSLDISKAQLFREHLSKKIKAVGVFVDADPEFIISLYEQNIIDVAQLHGSEDEAYIKKIKDVGIPVIKAFVVKSLDDVSCAEISTADYILLDAGKGSGVTFNWNLIQNIKRDYFLAGGLDTDNIAEAVTTLKPYAVDVSSGIETQKRKDPKKMRMFCSEVKNA